MVGTHYPDLIEVVVRRSINQRHKVNMMHDTLLELVIKLSLTGRLTVKSANAFSVDRFILANGSGGG